MIDKLILGIDVDGVLTDHRDKWLENYRALEEEHNHTPFDPTAGWLNQWEYFKDECRTCFYKCLLSPDIIRSHTLREGVQETLAELAANHTLYIITKRPEEVQESTKDWLFYNGIYSYFSGIYFTSDKNIILDDLKIDFHIDDSPEILRNIQLTKNTKAIRFLTSYNSHISEAPFTVSSWREYRDLIMLGKYEQVGV